MAKRKAATDERDRMQDWSFTISGSGDIKAARESARAVLRDLAAEKQTIVHHAWADPTHNEPI